MLPSRLQSPCAALPCMGAGVRRGLAGQVSHISAQAGGTRPPLPILTLPGAQLSPGEGHLCCDAAASPFHPQTTASALKNSATFYSISPRFQRNYLKTWSPDCGSGVIVDHLGFLYSPQAISRGGSAVARFLGETPAKPL